MDNLINLELESPFQPSSPVKPEFFKGREEIIKKILRYLNKSMKCDVQHFFLTGEKGMGKTSIAEFIMDGIKEFNVVSIYVSNKSNDSVDSLVSSIMKALLNKLPPKSRKDKIKSWFGNHVSEVNIYGTKFKFKLDEFKEEDIKDNFLDYLSIAYEDLKEEYASIFIVIDDINGLSKSKEFVDWYKHFADTVAVDDSYNLPIYFLLEGYADKFDDLVELEPSFGRIFHYDDVGLLDDDEIKSFFLDTFNSLGVNVDDEALDFMTRYTSGMPLAMQFIGDSVFWNLKYDKVSLLDAKESVIIASKNMGRNPLRRTLKGITNPLFHEMLTKIASKELLMFTFNQIEDIFTEKEMDNLPDFIKTVTNLGIIKKDEYSNQYLFKDGLFYVYYHIKAFEKEYS